MNELNAIHLPCAAPTCGTESTPVANARPTEPTIEFRALLERLREQAAALEKATEKTLSAGELSGAVQDAGASLQGALSIAEGLLEAYRAGRVVSAVGETRESARRAH